MSRQDKDQLLLFFYIVFSFMFYGIGINYGNAHPYNQAYYMTRETSPPEAAASAPEATTETTEAPKPVVVVLDAGHGGNDTGAFFKSEEGRIHEKTVNFKITKYLKIALEEYDNIIVVMTREKDKYLSLQERVDIALQNNADLFISLHNNTLVGAGGYATGSSIAVAIGNYNEEVAQEGQRLGANIAYELGKLGLKQNGLLMRSSRSYTYPNGRAADYYATIRGGMEHDIPSVIIEHAFIDNKDDFYDYLCSEKQLKEMAAADARGIARYLQVPRKDDSKVLEPLDDYKIKVCHIKKNGSAKKTYRIYYTDRFIDYEE